MAQILLHIFVMERTTSWLFASTTLTTLALVSVQESIEMFGLKTHPIHIGQWGTYVTTSEVSASSAMVDLEVSVNNDSESDVEVTIETEIYELDSLGVRGKKSINRFPDS